MSLNEGSVKEGDLPVSELGRIRHHFVTGGEEIQKDGLSRFIREILSQAEKFRDLVESWQEHPIQNEIVEACKKVGCRKIDEDFGLAKASARGLMFDCLADAVVGRKARMGIVDLHTGGMHTALINEPYQLLNDQRIVEYLADRLTEDGSKFLLELSADFHNAERRGTARNQVDMQDLFLARQWTDPHMPLWLMTRQTILSVCKDLLPSESWTESQIKNRQGKGKLAGPKLRPIVGVTTKSAPDIHFEFQIRKVVFEKMTETTFVSRFHYPGRATREPTDEDNEEDGKLLKEATDETLSDVMAALGKKYAYNPGGSIPIRAVSGP